MSRVLSVLQAGGLPRGNSNSLRGFGPNGSRHLDVRTAVMLSALHRAAVTETVTGVCVCVCVCVCLGACR